MTREKPDWKKFNDCIWQLENAAKNKRKHTDFSMEMSLADALFELLKVPHWKLWIWIPKILRVRKANNLHIKCCSFERM